MVRLLCTVCLTVMTATAYASAPVMLPVQGVVLDNTGTSVAAGTFAMTFGLYAAATGGEPLWAEVWPPSGQTCDESPDECVDVASGVFALMLGAHEPLDPLLFAATPELWLGVQVESEPELARRRLGTR